MVRPGDFTLHRANFRGPSVRYLIQDKINPDNAHFQLHPSHSQELQCFRRLSDIRAEISFGLHSIRDDALHHGGGLEYCRLHEQYVGAVLRIPAPRHGCGRGRTQTKLG